MLLFSCSYLEKWRKFRSFATVTKNSLTMANYINPFTDIGFKRIFGQEFSKPLLIDFLNNLLIGEKRIVDFEKGVEVCENDFDRWIYVLKNMETIKRLPWAAQNSVFQKLAEIADVSSLTKEERLHYDEALRKYRDTLCVLEGAEQRGLKRGHAEGLAKGLAKGREEGLAKGLAKGREEGLAKGRAEGLAKGRAEERIEIARNMKANGLPVDLIAACSGLSPEEIAQL